MALLYSETIKLAASASSYVISKYFLLANRVASSERPLTVAIGFLSIPF